MAEKIPQSASQMTEVLTLQVFRDGIQSPLGFRLRGGADVEGGTPLEIVKVSVGSASDGVLFPGDRILSINRQNVTELSHFEAQHLFKASGTSVMVELARVVHHPLTATLAKVSCTKSNQSQTQESSSTHPGYVQAAPPQLPLPKDSLLSKPQESETFKMILKAEISGAQNQSSIDARQFRKGQTSRPLSQASDLSDESRSTVDPLLKDTSINQSSSFKKLMQSVLGETDF